MNNFPDFIIDVCTFIIIALIITIFIIVKNNSEPINNNTLIMSSRVDKIVIYNHQNMYYDLDINNISYDSISKEDMILAIRKYPNSIYCSNGSTCH